MITASSCRAAELNFSYDTTQHSNLHGKAMTKIYHIVHSVIVFIDRECSVRWSYKIIKKNGSDFNSI